MCVDSTHGVTGYNFYLLSILVINQYGKGLIVGWAISSRENFFIWKLLAQSLRPDSLRVKPEVLMSDDDNASWNGLKLVWTSLKFKLLCHWHVKKNVRNNCIGTKCQVQMSTKTANSEQNEVEISTDLKSTLETSKFIYGTPIWELFYSLMKETDKETFFSMLSIFRKTCKAYNQQNLLQYFEKNYFPEHRIKQWATWFRKEMYGVQWLLNDNMHIESWHNYLKSVIMGRYKNVRVDKLLKILVQAETIIFWKWTRYRFGTE